MYIKNEIIFILCYLIKRPKGTTLVSLDSVESIIYFNKYQKKKLFRQRSTYNGILLYEYLIPFYCTRFRYVLVVYNKLRYVTFLNFFKFWFLRNLNFFKFW